MSKQKKYHYIYKTTCKITNKFYVGMHSTDNLEDGYLGSGKILGYSRKKHGDENHVREILEYLPSRVELKAREKEIVNEELLRHHLNINLKYGGDGGYENINQDRLNVYGKNGKIGYGGENLICGYLLNDKLKELGRFDEIQEKKSSSLKNTIKLYGHHMTGKCLSDIHKQRIKDTINERALGLGEKNSQFGTCWVTNGVKPIKIKKEKLDEYLMNGYSRGRKYAE